METEFKNGDLVRHSSQQTIRMVVLYLDNDGIFYCRYYNVITGNFSTVGFYPYELMKA
jgi:uncharacterized protein YodC (DUF2158 family)